MKKNTHYETINFLSFLAFLSFLIFSAFGNISVEAKLLNPAIKGVYDWKILDDGTVEITSFKGFDLSFINSNASKNQGNFEIIVPPTVKTIGQDGEIIELKVSSIGIAAFKNISTASSIKLPNGIKKIGKNAFLECTDLESIFLPDGLKIISDGAFLGCYKLKNAYIPDGVEYIGDKAFALCKSLEWVRVPSSLKDVGKNALYPRNTAYKIMMGYYSDFGLTKEIKNISDFLLNNSNTPRNTILYSDTSRPPGKNIYFKWENASFKGDIFPDGQINQLDVDALSGFMSKGFSNPSITLEQADLNNDGEINASDLIYLKRCIDGQKLYHINYNFIEWGLDGVRPPTMG